MNINSIEMPDKVFTSHDVDEWLFQELESEEYGYWLDSINQLSLQEMEKMFKELEEKEQC